MIVKIINVSEITECHTGDLVRTIALSSDKQKLAFCFEEDSVSDFFKDKTSYSYDQFITMTKDPSDAWYIG